MAGGEPGGEFRLSADLGPPGTVTLAPGNAERRAGHMGS